ncbi:unnamed protein product [Toxocara canis]|uniref:Transmembrane 9 superfamily member n=1 Tax=Toxocara canis TaxID=6265 RepID=A0A183VDA2_TOXCA|nr:unnamed protein product [Toxocara canis]
MLKNVLRETVRQEEDKKAFFSSQTIRIQWMAVLHSALLVVLLVLFVALILLSIVRRDLNRYNDAKDDDLLLENGWKTISMDVFRTPKHAGLFAAILAVDEFTERTTLVEDFSMCWIAVHLFDAVDSGARIYECCQCAIFLTLLILVLGSTNVVSVHRHGALYTLAVVLYACTSGNDFGIFYKYSGDGCICRYSAPCRIRNVPRQLPILPWYHSTIYFGFVGGFLPFSAISVELYYVFSAVWGREVYVLFYIILIMFFIMIMVVATTSVVLTYLQLNAEDYHWWWRSIFTGGYVCFILVSFLRKYCLKRTLTEVHHLN